MKKALFLAPVVAALVACGGDADDGFAGDTMGMGTTMPPPATTTDPYGAPGTPGAMGDTTGMMMGDTMMYDTMGMGAGTTPP